MIVEGPVTQFTQPKVSDGLNDGQATFGRYQGQRMLDSHAQLFDCVSRGNCYTASMQAAAALGTAFTATAVTITLYNPANSSKVLVLLRTQLCIVVATTAGHVDYAVNDTLNQAAPTATTPITVHNAQLGRSIGNVGQAFSAATLPATPVGIGPIAGIVSTTPGGVHSIIDKVDGAIQLYPNSMLTVQGITTNATGLVGFLWEEVDLN